MGEYLFINLFGRDSEAETCLWCFQPGCWLLGSSAKWINQLKAKNKWDQNVMLTASEDRYENLTEVK